MGRSVLLVEDDNLVRAALAAGLTHHGFDVTAVGDARSAMASFATNPPDVAVLDLHLGAGPTGLDLAVGMRERSISISARFSVTCENTGGTRVTLHWEAPRP